MRRSVTIHLVGILLACPLVVASPQSRSQATKVANYANPIVFVRAHFDESTGDVIHRGKIWIMDEDGAGLRQLTFGPEYDEHPAFFSERRFVLYSHFNAPSLDPSRGAKLIRMDTHSGRSETFAEVPGCALHHVTISPVDDTLVYQHDCDGRLSQRVGWGPDSYEIPMLARNGVGVGKGVIFMHEKNVHLRSEGGPTTEREVALIHLWGEGREVRARLVTDDEHLHRRPAVSADGQWIAWQTNASGDDDEIYLARTDGSEPRNITNNPGLDGHPWFSRDGQWIVFESDRSGNMEIWKINLATLRQEQLTTGGREYRSRTPRW